MGRGRVVARGTSSTPRSRARVGMGGGVRTTLEWTEDMEGSQVVEEAGRRENLQKHKDQHGDRSTTDRCIQKHNAQHQETQCAYSGQEGDSTDLVCVLGKLDLT